MKLKTAHLLRSSRGFTLIELVVVMGVLTILLAIVLVAINPQRQFQQANDTQRRSDVNAILNAIHQYAADNKGSLPTGISTTEKTICLVGGTVDLTDCPAATGVDLCTALVGTNKTYIADLPRDPGSASEVDPTTSATCDATGYDTAYKVQQSATGNRITVTAVGDITTTISVTR